MTDTIKRGFQKVSAKDLVLGRASDIIVFGDPGCSGFNSEAVRTVKKIFKMKADLYFVVGDIVQHGKNSEFGIFKNIAGRNIAAPVFMVSGNHDLPMYYKNYGSSTYAVKTGDFVFIVLDNSRRVFDARNLAFLKSRLKKYRDKSCFIVFHIPPPNRLNLGAFKDGEWQKLKGVMSPFRRSIAGILTGHMHVYLKYKLDGFTIYVSGGGGAKMWDLKGSKMNTHHLLRFRLRDNGKYVIKPEPL